MTNGGAMVILVGSGSKDQQDTNFGTSKRVSFKSLKRHYIGFSTGFFGGFRLVSSHIEVLLRALRASMGFQTSIFLVYEKLSRV